MNGMPPKVKICGIASLEDARAVNRHSPDYVGCVVDFPRSPRSVSREAAAAIFAAVAAAPVAVVVNLADGTCRSLTSATACRVVQLSGDESPTWVARRREGLAGEVWKTIHLSAAVPEDELARAVERVGVYREAGVDRFVLDRAKGAGKERQYGGTGETPDWLACARLGETTGASIVLAGGLNPNNVAAAIEAVNPFAVDVSSGVETSPGVKDLRAVAQFVEAVRRAT